jgi:hypothetical protein
MRLALFLLAATSLFAGTPPYKARITQAMTAGVVCFEIRDALDVVVQASQCRAFGNMSKAEYEEKIAKEVRWFRANDAAMATNDDIKEALVPLQAHGHNESEITGLVNDLAAKVATNDARLSDARTPLAHNQLKATITDFAHTHTEAEVTNLPADLAAKSGNIAQGTATFATTAIAAGACSASATIAVASGALANVVATDAVSALTYKSTVGVADGRLITNIQIAAGALTITRCNPSAASITGTAIVANWKVTR